jgi:UDP-glucose 4-epimerase
MPECYGETFNIGADRPYSVLQFAHEIAHALDVEPWIIYLPGRKEVMHAYADHAKVERVFGRSPRPHFRTDYEPWLHG